MQTSNLGPPGALFSATSMRSGFPVTSITTSAAGAIGDVTHLDAGGI